MTIKKLAERLETIRRGGKVSPAKRFTTKRRKH